MKKLILTIIGLLIANHADAAPYFYQIGDDSTINFEKGLYVSAETAEVPIGQEIQDRSGPFTFYITCKLKGSPQPYNQTIKSLSVYGVLTYANPFRGYDNPILHRLAVFSQTGEQFEIVCTAMNVPDPNEQDLGLDWFTVILEGVHADIKLSPPHSS